MIETASTVTAAVDTYLSSLRADLGPMTLSERDEIIREISAHIRDFVEESGVPVETILVRLGSAEQLATQYRDGMLIRRASRSISPVLLIRGALRLATKWIAGMVVLFVGLFGYIIGGGCVLSGLLKEFFPAHTGTWFRDGRMIASGTQLDIPQPPAHEVLGMWYIPLMLTVCGLTLLATTFVIRASLRISQRWQAELTPST